MAVDIYELNSAAKNLKSSTDYLTSNIVENLLPYHQSLNTFFISLLTLCFVLSILIRYLDCLKSNDEKPFPLKDILLHFVLVSVFFVIFKYPFEWIIDLSNYIAEKIFSINKSEILIKKYFGASFDKKASISIFSLIFKDFVSIIAGTLGSIAFYILNILRYFLLSIMFAVFPIVLSLSLIPSYGFSFLAKFFMTVAQVAFWIIIKSIIDLVLVAFPTDSFGGLFYVALMGSYIVSVIFTPLIAARLFGGADFSSLSFVSALVSSTISKVKGGFIK